MPQRPNISDAFHEEAITHRVDLLRFSESTKQDVLGILNSLQVDLQAKVEAADLAGQALASRTIRQEQLIKSTKATIDTAYRDAGQTLQSEMVDLAKLEGKYAQRTINDVIGGEVASTALTAKELEVLAKDTMLQGSPAAEWWAKQSADTQRQFSQQVRQGVMAGETNQQITQRIIGKKTGAKVPVTDPKTGKVRLVDGYTTGVMDASKRGATALVRTAVQTISNQVLIETYQANPDVIKGIQALATLDSRTTPICRARDGSCWDLNTGEPLPQSKMQIKFPGPPPWHWQALPKGTLISTKFGDVPIEKIKPGDLVLTHKGRYQPVTVLMGKSFSGRIWRINLDSGRTLRASDEHPVRTVSRGWIRADSLNTGDKLFQNAEQAEQVSASFMSDGISDDRPPEFDEHFIPEFVSTSAGFSFVTRSINFYNNPSGKGEIGDVLFNRNLKLKIGEVCIGESVQQQMFPPSRIRPQFSRLAKSAAFQDGQIFNGIVDSHSLAYLPSPVFGGIRVQPFTLRRKAFRRNAWGDCRQGRGVCLRSDEDPVFSTKVIQGRFTKSVFSLKAPDGNARSEMIPFNDPTDEVKFLGWGHSTIISIVGEHYNGLVYNLSVEEDETYVAEGQLVHNCRTVLIPVTKSWNELVAEAHGKDNEVETPEAQDRLDATPGTDAATGEAANPLTTQTVDLGADGKNIINQTAKAADPVTLHPADLIGTSDTLDYAAVRDAIDAGEQTKAIVAIRKDGLLYVVKGQEQVAAAVYRNAGSVEVKVVDAPVQAKLVGREVNAPALPPVSGQKVPAIADQVPTATRASMDGQVAGTTNYESWLKGKPAAFQDEVLGPARGQLFRDGALTLPDMVDPTGRALTLDELQARMAIVPPVDAGMIWRDYTASELARLAANFGLNAAKTRLVLHALGINLSDSALYRAVNAAGDNLPTLDPQALQEFQKTVEDVKAGRIKRD